MTPGIDPKVDYAFKKVFGDGTDLEPLRSLLQAILGFPVASVELMNPFNDQGNALDKLSVLDVKARDDRGRWFDVEMQMFLHAALVERLLYYWAKLYSGQLATGQDFRDLRAAYSICFLRGRRSQVRSDVYHSHYEMIDRRTGESPSDHFSIHIVELPKFTLGEDEVRTPEHRWCYFLQHAETLDPARMPASLNDPAVMKAMEVLMRISQDALERDRYESRLKWERDERQREYDHQEQTAALQKATTALQEKSAALQEKSAALQETAKSLAEAKTREVETLAGQVQFCQRLLGQPPTPKDELASKPVEELRRLADELRGRIEPAS